MDHPAWPERNLPDRCGSTYSERFEEVLGCAHPPRVRPQGFWQKVQRPKGLGGRRFEHVDPAGAAEADHVGQTNLGALDLTLATFVT